MVDVRDHGQGIAAEDLSILFQAYARLGRPQRATGLGLGLFVSREIVAAHGGAITATSRLGDGTTISVDASRSIRPRQASRAPKRRPTRVQSVIRLAIVEDHPALADGLATLIRGLARRRGRGDGAGRRRGHAPSSSASSPTSCCATSGSPTTATTASTWSAATPRARVHHATVASYPSYHARAVELGAKGYLSKMASADQILDAIRAVAAGGTAFPVDARRSASEALRLPTSRELEILALVAEGLSNVEIAERLSLRVKTVESQLRRLFDRYDVTSRTALARLAVARAGSTKALIAALDGARKRVFILADPPADVCSDAGSEGSTIQPAPPGGVSPSVPQPLVAGRSRPDGEGFTVSARRQIAG